MTEIKLRIKTLMTAISTLSEASSAQALDVKTGHAKPDSAPPPGVRDRRGRPDPDESLLEWFVWRLGEAGDSMGVALAVCEEAEIRLMRRLRKPEDSAPGAFGGVASAEDPKERDRRIAEDYEGLTPEEVARIETPRSGPVHPANIRRVRRVAKRDPESGMPNPDAAPGQEAEKVRQLKAEHPHLSVRQIARRVGISKTSAHRYLGEKAA